MFASILKSNPEHSESYNKRGHQQIKWLKHCAPDCAPLSQFTFNNGSIRVCPTGLVQNVKAFSALVLAWHESWSESILSLTIAVSCLQTTFSIMQRTDVKAKRGTTCESKCCCKCLEAGGVKSLTIPTFPVWTRGPQF